MQKSVTSNDLNFLSYTDFMS